MVEPAVRPRFGWQRPPIRRSSDDIFDANTGQFRIVDEIQCFAPETPVATPDGPRPIGEIRRGETVLAYDFSSGTWVPRAVAARHENAYRGPVITIGTDAGTLRTTVYHPFWVAAGSDLDERSTPRELAEDEDQGLALPGRWVNSHELRVGDVLVGTDGAERTVLSIAQEFRSGFPVVNLTIEANHTFAVGPDAVLVHNTARCDGRRMSAGEALDNGLSIRDEMWPRRGMHLIENHHPLMQGARYRRFWRNRGFTDAEIDNWTVPLDKDIHRAIEESGFWQDELLGEIKAQERLKGGFLTKGEVLGIVDNLLTKISGWSP